VWGVRIVPPVISVRICALPLLAPAVATFDEPILMPEIVCSDRTTPINAVETMMITILATASFFSIPVIGVQ